MRLFRGCIDCRDTLLRGNFSALVEGELCFLLIEVMTPTADLRLLKDHLTLSLPQEHSETASTLRMVHVLVNFRVRLVFLSFGER